MAPASGERATTDMSANLVDRTSSPQTKIALFRSLFRGRDDVYARRFESRRTGKSGYAPACANEWVRGVCEKPRIKCAECPNRRFLPVTDDVIRWHLSGYDPEGQPFVAGIYPLLQDETCFLLAVDFDKAGWRDDAAALLETCRRLNLEAAMERSRSGRGAHVWFFFEEAIPAALARRLGSHVLTETMEGRPDVGLDSYDRLFPNQDTMPQGGFGNLIALPLQMGPRKLNNGIFLDGNFVPWPDQWAFLAQLRRLDRDQVERIVQDAERRGRVLGVRLPPMDDGEDTPWAAPPSRRPREAAIVGAPEALEVILGNQIYIAKDGLPPALRNRLLRLAAFQNPEFYKAQSMRLSTYDKPRVIACAEDHAHHIGLPRGCLEEVRASLRALGVSVTVRDERNAGSPLEVSFQGELRPDQQVAADAMWRHDTGVLAASTAFGKTVVAAWLIARRRVSTLVLVHRRQLLDQWTERLSVFLGIPKKAIGRIGGGRTRPTGLLDVAVIQSLARKGVVDDRVAGYGHLIVDECHHLSAHSFEQVARAAKARFVMGLSATIARKDGHHPIIFMQCGPVRHRVDDRAQAKARPFEHLVLVQATSFQPSRIPDPDKRLEFQALYQDLVHDESRNRRIFDEVVESVNAGRSPLVLTERNDHLDRLEQGLAGSVRHLVVLRAGLGKKQRQAVADRLAAIPRDESRVILATGKYVGEGFDDPRLDTLFLTLRFRGEEPSRNMPAACIDSTTASAVCASTTTRISTSPCWRGCSTVAAAAMKPSATRFSSQRVPYPAGPLTSFYLRIQYGSGTIPAASEGWSGTASGRRWRASLSMPPGRCRQTRRAPTGHGVRAKRFSTGAWRRCRRPGAVSASTWRCLSRSTAREVSKWTCCARTPVWPWNWTAASISRIRSRTVVTGARISCCKRTASWSCGSWPKMLGRSWTRSSTPSFGR